MPTIKNRCPYEVTIRGVDLRSGQVFNNVLFYRNRQLAAPLGYGVSIVTSDLLTFINNVAVRWAVTLDDVVSEHYRMETITGKQVVNYSGVIGEPQVLIYGDVSVANFGTVNDQGDLAGETCPSYCAMSIRKVSDRAGRRYRGSMRIGPVTEAVQSNGTFTVAQHALNVTAAAAFAATPVENGAPGLDKSMDVCILSKMDIFFAAQPLVSSDEYMATVTIMIPHKNLGSQVSRKVRSDRIISEAV